jgi:hypothetical protein
MFDVVSLVEHLAWVVDSDSDSASDSDSNREMKVLWLQPFSLCFLFFHCFILQGMYLSALVVPCTLSYFMISY